MKNKFTIKNVIHIFFLLGVIILFIVQTVQSGTVNTLSIISSLMLPAVAYIGFLEILYLIGVTPILPEFYLESKKNSCVNLEINEIASKTLNDFSSTLKMSNDEFKLILSIKKTQYESAIRIKSDVDSLKCKLESSVKDFLRSDLVLTSSVELISTSMPNMNYYINFIDIFYNERFANEIIKTMVDFITLELNMEKYSQITQVVIPYNSNILLGFGVAKAMSIKAVKVVEKIPAYHLKKQFEGIISADDYNPEHTIIIHDVLYTGRQVIESCKILDKWLDKPEQNNNFGFSFFSLCSRKTTEQKDYGVKNLKDAGFDVHTLFEFDDKYIEKIRGK
jgi:hypothetical protein